MFLPAPQFVLVLIGNLLVMLLNIRRVQRQDALAAAMAEPFSKYSPDGLSITVLKRKKADAYLGAFIALFLIILAAVIFLPYGLDVWDPGYLDFWYDTDFLINMAMTLGFFVLPGLWVTVFYPGDLYVLTREGILHACRKGEEEFRWIEITDIQRYSGEGGSGLLLKAGRRTLDMPDRLSDPSAFYAQALKSLPVSLHDTEGYRWMGSRTRGPNGDRRKEGKEPMRDSGRP